MRTVVPWVLLGALVLYRRTWGACDCPALRRRLAASHREVESLHYEAHVWRTRAEGKP